MKTRGIDPTNNELEYLALLYGLEYVNNNYTKSKVTIYSDSMLIVNQINGKWRVTTPTLVPLYNKCIKQLKSNTTVKWIKRDLNKAGWVLDDLLKSKI